MSSPSFMCLASLAIMLVLFNAQAQAASFPRFQQRRAQAAKVPLLSRHMRSGGNSLEVVKESDLDPALQDLSTSELYRMLELIELMEKQKLEEVSPKDLKTLNYLMQAYAQ